MAQSASDETFVERCQQQLPYDTTAFETLVRRYEPVVFRFCHRYLHDEQDAEEACQDTFLRVFHGLPGFLGRASFRTWVFQIATRVCATKWSKRKTREKHLEAYRQVVWHDDSRVTMPPNPQFAEIGGIIGEGLDRLTPEDRAVLILRHVGELSLEELAETLEIGLSAAKMRLYRAEQRLRAAVSE